MDPISLVRGGNFRQHELNDIERILASYQEDTLTAWYPESSTPPLDSHMTFTPADFCIGESGIWFFSLMWEHGKDKEPVEFLDDKNLI